MLAHSQISILSLVKINIQEKFLDNLIQSTYPRMDKHHSPTVTDSPAKLIEDLPPSYYSTITSDVDETSTKEFIKGCNTVIIVYCVIFITNYITISIRSQSNLNLISRNPSSYPLGSLLYNQPN